MGYVFFLTSPALTILRDKGLVTDTDQLQTTKPT